jgi:hypothetical protein
MQRDFSLIIVGLDKKFVSSEANHLFPGRYRRLAEYSISHMTIAGRHRIEPAVPARNSFIKEHRYEMKNFLNGATWLPTRPVVVLVCCTAGKTESIPAINKA